MNASELIELLRKHPKACAILDIIVDANEPNHYSVRAENNLVQMCTRSFGACNVGVNGFRRWLVGACVEWCDANGIVVELDAIKGFRWYWSGTNTPTLDDDVYLSRIHAMLAAMEAHDRLAP